MAGALKQLSMATSEVQNPWHWKVQYARCFTYPSSYLAKTTVVTTATSPSSCLTPLKLCHFKPIWITSSGMSTVALHPATDGSSSDGSVLTVSLQGTIIEEHFISNLQFVWPQISCLSGDPTRGSLIVLVSYIDSSDEKQKFAMKFSGVSAVQDFIIALEDALSNKIPGEPSAVDVISATSSQSEIAHPYRPDTSSIMTPYDSTSPKNVYNEDEEDPLPLDTVVDSQSNVDTFPPRFTSLVSSCSAEQEKGNSALALIPGSQDLDLKAQISQYMQDATFLDMVSKVNEVITELGDDFTI
ncbi:hypothetical protein SOVF_129860 [Spinacia oleracea]|uniref:Protein POOR HOMOLOGOUS SYNAPSIS 1 n=1 Tax=Spinacia oleracea TaxID=3562 RepID=A0A9R0J508_SPIOL|nr:protein POOR HOMOLOGOUS SYNAPSIS 1-like [Spinacia oleracea]KNA12005.1 hypothetical protein SOVF_129860 [Spinacia oleracea]